VGLTGPYGNPFTLKSNFHYLMVAGGYGAAPLAFLAEEALKQNSTVDFLLGARSADYLLFEKRLAGLVGLKLHLATDDGSKGHRGYVTDLLPNLANGHEKIMVATCGPELMEKKILEFCNERGLDCEISLERYMKCGFGLCGQCAVDPIGLCVCKNGPVFSKKIINQISEFGKYHRDKSGKINNF